MTTEPREAPMPDGQDMTIAERNAIGDIWGAVTFDNMPKALAALRAYAALAHPAPSSGSEAQAELARLRLENWQLKAALGYPVPADIPEGDFKCGLCDARRAQADDDVTGLVEKIVDELEIQANERIKKLVAERAERVITRLLSLTAKYKVQVDQWKERAADRNFEADRYARRAWDAEARVRALEAALKRLITICEDGSFDGVDFEFWCGKESLKQAREALALTQERKED